MYSTPDKFLFPFSLHFFFPLVKVTFESFKVLGSVNKKWAMEAFFGLPHRITGRLCFSGFCPISFSIFFFPFSLHRGLFVFMDEHLLLSTIISKPTPFIIPL